MSLSHTSNTDVLTSCSLTFYTFNFSRVLERFSFRARAHRDAPRKMRVLIYQRYCESSTFSKAATHSSLTRSCYTGQAMQDYIARSELMNARLTSMNAPIGKRFLATLLVESFGDRSLSSFRTATSALLTKGDPIFE